MQTFTRPDKDAKCDPRHLAEQLGVEAVDIEQEKVHVHGEPPANAQAIIDAYVYDPDYGKPAEETTLKAEVAQRLQTLDDATKTKAAWDGLTNAQRQEAVRQGLQLLVRLTRFVGKRLL